MNKEFEALKRLKQETCPATYNQDFDKNKCCNIIENALNVLKILIDKQVDISQIYDSANYNDYTNKLEEFFTNNVEANLGSEQDKELWWECYYLTEEEYDLVRSLL